MTSDIDPREWRIEDKIACDFCPIPFPLKVGERWKCPQCKAKWTAYSTHGASTLQPNRHQLRRTRISDHIWWFLAAAFFASSVGAFVHSFFTPDHIAWGAFSMACVAMSVAITTGEHPPRRP